MSPSWLGGRGRERPSSPSCSPGHGGYVPDDAQGGKRCTGGASAASRLPTPSRLPAPAPPSVRQVGRAWPVLQGGRVGGAWPVLQGSRCSRVGGLAGAPGQQGRAWPGLQGGRGQHTPGGGWVHLRTAGVPGPRTWRRREVRGAHPDLVPTWRSPRPCARRRGHGGAHASVFSSCVFTFFFF